jgi:hypothetical protein
LQSHGAEYSQRQGQYCAAHQARDFVPLLEARARERCAGAASKKETSRIVKNKHQLVHPDSSMTVLQSAHAFVEMKLSHKCPDMSMDAMCSLSKTLLAPVCEGETYFPPDFRTIRRVIGCKRSSAYERHACAVCWRLFPALRDRDVLKNLRRERHRRQKRKPEPARHPLDDTDDNVPRPVRRSVPPNAAAYESACADSELVCQFCGAPRFKMQSTWDTDDVEKTARRVPACRVWDFGVKNVLQALWSSSEFSDNVVEDRSSDNKNNFWSTQYARELNDFCKGAFCNSRKGASAIAYSLGAYMCGLRLHSQK